MKKCKSIEKQFVAYLHGELNECDHTSVEQHLENCGACRAQLDAERATLELLGEALAAAPAPEQLSAWRTLPHRVSAHRPTWSDYWYSPRLRAALVTGAAFSMLFFISISLVTISVMHKEEKRFNAEATVETPGADRPQMKLKKLNVPFDDEAVASAPKLRKRMVAAKPMRKEAEIQIPEPAPIVAAQVKEGAQVARSARMLTMPERHVSFGIPATDFFGTRGRGAVPEFNTEQYDRIVDNTFKESMQNPLSTFSIDVDRASYANVRRFLTDNRLPPPDAVRIEEMVNYFDYDYPQPEDGRPFVVSTEVSDCPWNTGHQLALIGLQGLEIETKDLPPNNLVFLLDVSGSMNRPDKLPLLKTAMRLLVDQLRPEDRVSIVVYAGAAGLVLEPTSDKGQIRDAIKRLRAGGSTAGGAGIELAYRTAQESYIEDGNNRVILATDGDFNVGVSSDGALTRLIEKKRESDIFLTVLGFGSGNYKDSKMEKLADKGNGNYAYIDDILEAKKVLINEMGGTLVTIAKDVKVQVEFNPALVKAYRLIGYENRTLAKEDFDDDKKDAGELGAGHTVTALYELIPAGSGEEVPVAGALKYQVAGLVPSDELMTVKLRYKQPRGEESRLIVKTVEAKALSSGSPSENLRFAGAVAEFGLLLRNSQYKADASFSGVLRRARDSRGADAEGYRAEFIRLVEKAELLSPDSTMD
jgi:Ca-activated chloride channel family protein